MEKPQFKTGEFEGPLDLLLYLIQKHKLDICDIEISALLEQYLAYIDAMGQDDLEIASEFLEMAARLVYIKTAMLLPRHEEEGVKLKAELQGQLLEYQVCQRVAAQLGALSRLYLNFARQPMKLPADHSYRLTHSPQILYDAYRDAAGRTRPISLPIPQATFGTPTRTRSERASGGFRRPRRPFPASFPGGWYRSAAGFCISCAGFTGQAARRMRACF